MPVQNSTQRTQIRNTLLENGYVPLPLAAKGVFIKGWSRAEITADWLKPYARNGRYPNTGIRCDNLIVFDIDVYDEDLADACEEYINDRCQFTPLCRVGQWPKRALVYRCEDPENARSGRTGKYGPHMCEILCSHGRQFAAFGTHPGTKEPYYWEADDGVVESPLTIKAKDLPSVTAELAEQVLNELDELLAKTGLPKERRAHMRGESGNDVWDLTGDTEVMVAGQIVLWKDLVKDLTSDGVFGNLWREEYGSWGDSDAVHFYVATGSNEACAHDFVNDCTHWESIWQPQLAQLLPPRPDKPGANKFIPSGMADMIENCVLMTTNEVRRLSDPLFAYPLAGFRNSVKYLRVAHPNPPRNNPNATIEFFDVWQKDPNTLRADRAKLLPTHPDEPIVTLGRTRYLNVYRRPEHAKDGLGEAHTFYEFIRHLIPSEAEQRYFLGWLSHKVAHPGDRMHGMVMVTRAYGTGRGTLVQIMQRLFGEQYVNEVELSDITGTTGQSQFNGYLAESLLITVAEALEERIEISKWQARHIAYERLKTVCDPIASNMHVRRKYGTNSVERIHASVFISSNHLDALAIEPGDRRIIVLDNTDVPLPQAPNNLNERIHAWATVPANIARLYYDLLDTAHSYGYDAQGAPPDTPAKDRMIEAGQSDVDQLFEHFLDETPGDIVTPFQWRNFAYTARLRFDLDLPADPKRAENAISAVIQNKARRLEALPKGGQIKIKGAAVRPWVVRNFAKWCRCEDREGIRDEVLKNGEPGGALSLFPSS